MNSKSVTKRSPVKNKKQEIKIDKKLEKYKDKVLFKEKLESANRILKTVGLPKN